MRENLFEIGAKFDDGWSSDNKSKPKVATVEIKEPAKHRLYLAKEKRRGKTVTIIKPFFLKESDLKTILKLLKSKLGSGGTIKDNSIELQGEVAKKAKELLQKEGFGFR